MYIFDRTYRILWNSSNISRDDFMNAIEWLDTVSSNPYYQACDPSDKIQIIYMIDDNLIKDCLGGRKKAYKKDTTNRDTLIIP